LTCISKLDGSQRVIAKKGVQLLPSDLILGGIGDFLRRAGGGWVTRCLLGTATCGKQCQNQRADDRRSHPP